MRILLDSNILYWALIEPTRLSSPVSALLQDMNNEAWVSSLSMAELRIKQRIGKLTLPDVFDQEVLDLGYQILPFRFEHAGWLAKLELHHRDPFDRMIIAQAIEDDLTIVTSDPQFSVYPVSVLLN
jgi:PIN domain nuclease of toxin-antitoxin system